MDENQKEAQRGMLQNFHLKTVYERSQLTSSPLENGIICEQTCKTDVIQKWNNK